MKVVAVAADMVTAYGWGSQPCWSGLMSGKTAIRRFDRISRPGFPIQNAAYVAGLDPDGNDTLVMQMLRPLMEGCASAIPRDAFLILATTNGEIDILERAVLNGSSDVDGSRLDHLLGKIERLCGLSTPGMVVCAACASSSAAVAAGAAMIREGRRDCVLAVGCDNVSEFVAAGFASLRALDPDMARPFDRNRRGLSLGEAAGFMLLMSDQRAAREGRPALAEVLGWGMTGDAHHITGPSPDGNGLALALQKALQSAGISPEEVGSFCAHGTGTAYNDSMEMRAIRSVLRDKAVPVYSLKGAVGHSMGTAGLVDLIVAIQTLAEQVVPPTVNLRDIDDEARGWVSPQPVPCAGEVALSSNSGFGGINCAIVLKRAKGEQPIQ